MGFNKLELNQMMEHFLLTNTKRNDFTVNRRIK